LDNIVIGVACGSLGILTGLILFRNTNKKKVNKKHDCFKKCRPVFEYREIFDQQLKEKKYSVKTKDLVIFQACVFSSIIESKKDELCSKHYQEFKEINDEEVSLVENISKNWKELFKHYKYDNCGCKKVLEKIFEVLRQAKDLKDNEKLAVFYTLLKENRESFCDEHQNFYESFSKTLLSHE